MTTATTATHLEPRKPSRPHCDAPFSDVITVAAKPPAAPTPPSWTFTILSRAPQGGQHEADNLITLCGAHHRALHRGALRIEGRVSLGVQFVHADGRPYGAAPQAAATAVRSEGTPFIRAFSALRRLGFPERDVRRALCDLQTHVGADVDSETILRQSVALLTQGAIAHAS